MIHEFENVEYFELRETGWMVQLSYCLFCKQQELYTEVVEFATVT